MRTCGKPSSSDPHQTTKKHRQKQGPSFAGTQKDGLLLYPPGIYGCLYGVDFMSKIDYDKHGTDQIDPQGSI
jgi:hypothetical protein